MVLLLLQAITYNKQLREQIDNLRRERLMFEAIDHNLDKELARIKRNMAGKLPYHSTHSKQLSDMLRPSSSAFSAIRAMPNTTCEHVSGTTDAVVMVV